MSQKMTMVGRERGVVEFLDVKWKEVLIVTDTNNASLPSIT